MAVSAIDSPSFNVTIYWDADFEVGPVELVPRFSMREAIENDGAVSPAYSLSNRNVVWQQPIQLDGSSGITKVTMRIKVALLPMSAGV